MTQSAVFAPMLCLFLVTAAVWVLLLVRRLSFFSAHKIHPQSVKTPEAVKAVVPDKVEAVGNNLVNRFEIPVIFYGLTLIVAVAGIADDWFISGAWAFVGLRALHSVVHCTYNKVMHRFMVYVVSSLILWALVIKVVLQLGVL